MTDNPDVTVDGRFTPDGISISVYGSDGTVQEEVWFSNEQVEARAEESASDFTFEFDMEDFE